jgi:hypothetical protein
MTNLKGRHRSVTARGRKSGSQVYSASMRVTPAFRQLVHLVALANMRPNDPRSFAADARRLLGQYRLDGFGLVVRRATSDELKATCDLVRDRVGQIVGGENLAALIRELQDHHVDTRHIVPSNKRSVTNASRFRLVDVPKEQNLTWLVGEAFVRTAVEGLWPKLFRCAQCQAFGVTRTVRSSRLFCRGKSCRRNFHRRQNRLSGVDPQADRERSRAFGDYVRNLCDAGVPPSEAFPRGCQKFGYPPSGPRE